MLGRKLPVLLITSLVLSVSLARAKTMAMNALLGGKKQSSSGGGLGGLASQFLGGSGGGHGGGSSGGNGIAGQLAGKLASNLFSSSDKPPAPQNYHGGQGSNKPSHQGGIAGAVFGGVAHMFGGKESHGVSLSTLPAQDP